MILRTRFASCLCTVILITTGGAAAHADTVENEELAALAERMTDIVPKAEDLNSPPLFGATGKTLATCGPWLKYTLDYSPALNSVAFNGSRWVVVGTGDDIYYSDDGLEWHWRDGGTNKTFTTVRWFGSKFVAVGEDGVIVTSSDGYSWTQRGTPTSEELRGLAVSPARIVAVGRGGAVLWSLDGQNWNVGQSPTSDDIFCVEYFAGRFRLIDGDGDVYDSSDGSVWIFRGTLPSFPQYGSILGMGASSSVLVAVGFDVELPSPGGGVIYTTTDGTSWQKLQPPCDTLRGAVFGADKWVAVGDSTILENTGAGGWQTVSNPLSGRIWEVAFGDDQFIAPGWEGIARQICEPTTTCTYNISPTSANFGASGGNGSFSVTTQSGCPWSASSNNPWISITSGASGTGSGIVSYSVAPSNSPAFRTGTITAGGQIFTIMQDAAPSCDYTISPTSQSFGSSGGNGTVTVTTASGCTWNASAHKLWIHITSGSNGSGSGSVSYSVDPNAGESRTGTMTIAGETFTVTQSDGGGGGDFIYQTAGIAHAGGTGGSVWRSTLCVTNRSGAAANVTLVYHMASGSITRNRTIENGRIMEWEDVAVSLFGQSNNTSGSIEIKSDVPVMVVARTYNEGASGTFGQGMPGNDDSVTLRSSQIGVLPQLKKTQSFRTNIGLMNHGSSACTVRVKLYGEDGSQVGNTITSTVQAFKWRQINDVFGEAGVSQCDIGYATVEVTTLGGKIWAYASVVDNGTGDPTTVPLFIE